MKKIVLLVVCAVLFPAQTLFAAGPNMKEGNWEVVTSMKMEGMPFPIPPMKINHCYTSKEIEDSKNPAASDADKKNECTVKDQRVTGNKVTWNMACKDGSTGSGEASYNGNTFDSITTFKDKSGTATTTSMKGKRLGDCK